MNSKGQTSGLDLVIAFILVAFILISVMEVWNNTISKLSVFQSKKTSDNRLLDISELLLKTPGDPVNWYKMGDVNPSTVKTIGFAAEDNILDPARIEKASEVDYDDLKDILGLSKEEIHITVTDLESWNRTTVYELGKPAEDTALTLSRYALLNDSMVELRITLYYANTTYMTM